MPELPEVETVRRILNKEIVGRKIIHIDCYYNPIIHEDLAFFKRTLKNQVIQRIERYGKYLVFVLNDDALIIHLRMEGKFYIKDDEPKSKHEHIIFRFENGQSLRYHDVRKFGTMHLKTLKTYRDVYPLNTLGPEPKDAVPTVIYQRLHHKKIAVKTALLDQHIISGLGNIYVDETLFLSHIKPTRLTHQLTQKEVERLVNSAKKVCARAIELGGSTIRSYTASLGVHGRFQNELNVHTRVGQPCPVCGTLIRKTKVGGRGTYVCPTCQK